MRKGKFHGLEVELASSILYYDKEELQNFMDVFDAISAEPNMVMDGTFVLFVTMIRKVPLDDLPDDPEKRKALYVDSIMARNDHRPSADDRETFSLWMEQVLQTNVPMELAEDVLHHFVWEEYKKSIALIDRLDVPFEEKLALRPKMPKALQKNGVVHLDEIEVEDESQQNRYTSGVEVMDRKLRFADGCFAIIAARPGVGKSLFMLQMAIANAKKGVKCLYVSKEMNTRQLNERIMNYHTGHNLREECLDDLGFVNLDMYRQRIADARKSRGYKAINDNLHLYITNTSNAQTILNNIEDLVKEEKYEFVFLDYLQLFTYVDLDEWGSIRMLTKDCKNLAMRLHTRVISGSQVSRASTERGLYLSDLYGGSTIEADTDIVMGMEELRERKGGPEAVINLKIMKNRDGDLMEERVTINYTNGRIYDAPMY